MKLAIKYLSQFLFIPLIEKLFKAIVKKIEDWNKDRIERRALEEANREIQNRVGRYEESSADDAFDNHP